MTYIAVIYNRFTKALANGEINHFHILKTCESFLGKIELKGNEARDSIEMETDANVEEESQQLEDITDDPVDVSHSTRTTTNV